MAGEEITVDQLRQLLGVQADLRQQAESRWQQAQRILVSLLESFAPEEVERRLKSGQPLGQPESRRAGAAHQPAD